MLSHSEVSDSEHVASKKVAVSLGISGHYGAFSGAASMEVSKSTNERIRTMRIDSVITATTYQVSSKGTFRTSPYEFLTENFKESVKKLTVEQIENRIGVFYARQLDLGGEVRQSYTMQVTEDDTQSSVKAELEMSYGNALMGASAKFGTGVSSRESNRNAQMRTEWQAQGGNTVVWLGKDLKSDASVDKVKAEWAKTIDDTNLYSFNFELGYVWELVKHVDKTKGEEFQRYLEKKWNAAKNAFRPSQYAKSE
jgi:hypothetical protein